MFEIIKTAQEKRNKHRQSKKNENKRKPILNFNHISGENPHSKTLQEYYFYYHKIEFCYNKKFKKYKGISLTLDIISAIIVAISTSTSITLTPLTSIISILSLGTQYLKKKMKFAEKSENYKQATILINRILIELKKLY